MGFLQIFNKLTTKKNEITKISKDTFTDIPKEIIELLWFKDGPYKNYNENNDKKEIDMGGIRITISMSYNTEPSLISTSDTITEPKNKDIEPPGYYPSYSSLNPNQRWIYLNWLKNIDTEIDISYVFIFYYGLERNLFLGDYIKAWTTVNKLRKYHKNTSFIAYSTEALIASCIVHNRPDLFIDLLQNTNDVDDIAMSDLYLLAKYKLCGDITQKEIMKLASGVEFKNYRYLKNDELIFENELINILLQKYGKDSIELSNFNINKSPKKSTTIMANYSMNTNQRVIEIPSLIENKEAQDLGIYRCNLLQVARIYEHIDELQEALKLYMAACYYDLNGASNSGLGFDSRDIFLAPGVIKWINKTLNKLKMNENKVQEEFEKIVSEYKEQGMFMKNEIAWKCMYKALYEGILVRGNYTEILEQILVTM